MNKLRLIALPAIILLLSGCLNPVNGGGNASNPDQLVLMSWNCQNLFDAIDDGTEYDEFDPGRGIWTEESYQTRLSLTASVIRSSDPDILFLQEVENRRVVEDLNRQLGRGGYRWVVVTEQEGTAIQSAVLSRYPLERIRFWQPGYFLEEPLRPVTEVQARIGTETFLLFNNHWKSKREGVPETEPARCRAAALLALRASAGPLVISAGDFNTELDDPGLAGTENEGPAFFHWVAGSGFQNGSLPVVSFTERASLSPLPAGCLIDLWGATGDWGSYCYQEEWSRPDHFLLSETFFDGKDWEFGSLTVGGDQKLLNDRGEPNRWMTWTGTGFSDHLPLRLLLVRESGE